MNVRVKIKSYDVPVFLGSKFHQIVSDPHLISSQNMHAYMHKNNKAVNSRLVANSQQTHYKDFIVLTGLCRGSTTLWPEQTLSYTSVLFPLWQ